LTYDYTSGQPYRKPDTIASASAGQEQLNYDPTSHRVKSKVDRNNVTTSYEYKDGLHQTAMTEAVGSPQQRRTETDWNSAINRIVARRIYNASGSNGGIETQDASAYNARGQVSAHCEIDPAINGASAYSCGSQINAPAGVRQWSYTYCEQSDVTAGTCPLVGLLLSTDGPRTDVSDVTGYVYYLSDDPACATTPAACSHRKGDLWKVTNARDQVTTYVSYDPSGRATRMQDANGVYTDITYHPRGWLLTRTVRANADGTPNSTLDATTNFGYDNVGNVTSVVQPDGTAMEYGYDDANRLTDIYDSPSITNTANSDHIKYTLDAAGNRKVESTYDPTGALKRALTRQYDQLNQLVAVLNGSTPSVAVQQFENPPPPETLPPGATDGYDGNGNAFYSVDTNGVGTEQQYDPLNRLVKTLQDHAGTGTTHDTTTKYAYDARDNLRIVTDPDNLVTSYTYDGLNNLTQLTSPDTGTTTYGTATQPGYDAAGNRLVQTDANGITTTYSYDALNRLTGITYPTASLNVTYAYDAPATGCYNIGRLTQITDSSGSTTYCYDARGNVVTKTQVTGGTTLTTGYTYTLADRIANITYPSGAIVSYGRDTVGRVTSVTYKANATATAQTILSNVSYYPFGPASVFTFGNGRTLTKTYDQNYAINTVASSDPNGLAITAGVDPLGNLTHASNGANPPSQTYGYDNLYRLTGVTDSSNNTVEAYTYGLTGDRLSKTYQGATSTYTYTSPLSTHRLQSDGVDQYGYDSDGNTLSIGQGGKFSLSPTTNLIFDDRNRMSEADYGNSSCYSCSTTSATYDYNGRGERVTKSVTVGNVQFNNFVTTTTDYVYNESGQLLGEYPGTSDVTPAEYIYLDATPVAYVTNGTVYYVETDQLGTPRDVVKPGTPDTIVWKWDYFASAFGENAPNQDPGNTGTAFTFNLRFPGQYFDAETGLNYNYFRDYEPGTGRYVESDPIGLNGGLNSYRYAYANPSGYLDQYGLCTALYCLPTTTTSRLVSRTQVSDSGWQYDNYHEYDNGFPSDEANVLELIDLGIDLPSQFKGEIRVQCMYHRTKRYDDRYVNVRVTACLELCTDCENRRLRWVNHEDIAGYFNREDIDVRSMYLDVEAGIPAITCLEILKDLR
jgi:RHS repeat-associated protein